jgi:XTP/dITP diphosphohydrolase
MPPLHRDRLVVATSNPGKLDELKKLLADLPITVLGVEEVLSDVHSVIEDGETFVANAIKKARAAAEATLMLSLGDDSGLEVDLLGGRPGVRSARFAHERATDAENNAALLAAIESARSASGDPVAQGYGTGPLTARFRCVLALVDPFTRQGEPRIVEGVCEGEITRLPRGSGGFGYDPLFIASGTDTTLAELDMDAKNRISHRGAALVRLRPLLGAVLRERAEQAGRLD